MIIRIESLLEGAQRAAGAVVVIDVFRAFTTAAMVLANGAERIVMVGSVAEALSLRESGFGQVCIGEVNGIPPAGFDFGNSPHQVSGVDFRGKTAIQRTSAGTQGIVTVRNATSLFAGSLVTASATARALRATGSPLVSLVAMGKNAESRTDEDEMCALHLRNLLEGRPGAPAAALRGVILACEEALRFGGPAHPESPAEDLEIALDVDRFDFAIPVTIEDGRPVARMLRG